MGNKSAQGNKLVLQDSRDKLDEAHLKLELLTELSELSDDFQKCVHCKYNPYIDKNNEKYKKYIL